MESIKSKKYFVVSDIHSFYDELLVALHKHKFDIENENHILIVCGDIFDRGPKSIELFEFLKSLPKERLIFVGGNHEDLLEECYQEIVEGKTVGAHHLSNGTIRTISQFTNLEEYAIYAPRRTEQVIQKVKEKIQPVIDWIDETSVNYAEIGKYIFVHGWVPLLADGIDCFGNLKNPHVAPRKFWDNDSDTLWREARWDNGMSMWSKGCKVEGKTVVCGHFHSSWGHSHLHQDRKEFPAKNRKDWKKSFEPFIDDGIIAIDSCCAYSGFINCVVLGVEN